MFWTIAKTFLRVANHKNRAANQTETHSHAALSMQARSTRIFFSFLLSAWPISAGQGEKLMRDIDI